VSEAGHFWKESYNISDNFYCSNADAYQDRREKLKEVESELVTAVWLESPQMNDICQCSLSSSASLPTSELLPFNPCGNYPLG